MLTLVQRRRQNILITLLAAGVMGCVVWLYERSLAHSAFVTGWVLLVLMVFLSVYNVRKKLPFLPLGSSSIWLQCHIYVGLFTLIVFPMHVSLRVPDGLLEATLALLLLVVAGSGVVGAWLSRTIPPRLSVRGEEVIFERIPAFRARLRDEARQLALQSVALSGHTTLADYHAHRLESFFGGPRNFWQHLIQSSRPCHRLLAGLKELDRYLSQEERSICENLSSLVRKKDNLDYHHAMQLVLKGWFFIHLGFTYSLLILAAVHAMVVYGYAGGGR